MDSKLITTITMLHCTKIKIRLRFITLSCKYVQNSFSCNKEEHKRGN